MAFAPCSFALIPAYFAVTFKEKTKLVKSTIYFFIGFASTFSFLGLTASLIGRIINIYGGFLTKISGVFFLILALMSLFDKSFSFKQKKSKTPRTPYELIAFGALFAIGFTACTGPVFFAILTLAANLPTYASVAYTFFYSLGLFIPLFIMSIFFDKINFAKLSVINKPLFTIKSIEFKAWNVIAFLLFAILGIVFLFSGDTSAIQYGFEKSIGNASGKIYAFLYSIQDYFLENGLSDIILIAILIPFLVYFFFKYNKKLLTVFNG